MGILLGGSGGDEEEEVEVEEGVSWGFVTPGCIPGLLHGALLDLVGQVRVGGLRNFEKLSCDAELASWRGLPHLPGEFQARWSYESRDFFLVWSVLTDSEACQNNFFHI